MCCSPALSRTSSTLGRSSAGESSFQRCLYQPIIFQRPTYIATSSPTLYPPACAYPPSPPLPPPSRLNRRQLPQIRGKSSNQKEKLIVDTAAGRVLCDTYLSARELVRETTYSLTHLAKARLGVDSRVEIDPMDVPRYFQVSSYVQHGGFCVSKAATPNRSKSLTPPYPPRPAATPSPLYPRRRRI